MNIKKIITLVVLFFLAVSVIMPAFANGSDFVTDTSDRISGTTGATIDTMKNKAWGSIKLILQVAALSAVLFAGVRYMMASADQKADIKKSMVPLVIGAVIVFGTTILIEFVQEAAGSLFETH